MGLSVNVGAFDRLARIVFGIALVAAGALEYLEGIIGIIVATVGAIIAITGLLGHCWLYSFAKFSTMPGGIVKFRGKNPRRSIRKKRKR